MAIKESILPEFEREMETTRLLLARVAASRLNHLIHYRGQLTVYLRLRDVALPSAYDPTAANPL